MTVFIVISAAPAYSSGLLTSIIKTVFDEHMSKYSFHEKEILYFQDAEATRFVTLMSPWDHVLVICTVYLKF